MTRFVRVRHGGEPRVARLRDDDTIEILDHDDPLAAIAGHGATVTTTSLDEVELLPPIEAPEIWCAGVTY